MNLDKKMNKSVMSELHDTEAFALICKVDDEVLARKLTIAVSDALTAKYRKGLSDGCEIGAQYDK